MERLFQSLGYSLDRQATNIEVAGTNYDISYTCHDLGKMPFIIIGEGISADGSIDTLDKCPSTIVSKAACARNRLMPLCSNISTPQKCIWHHQQRTNPANHPQLRTAGEAHLYRV